MDMFIEPKNILSPYTGNSVFPKISTYTHDGKTYEQAVYTDPITGHFVKKGLVSIKDAKTGEILQSYEKNQLNSLNNQSYR
jgi:hypothetical protein